MISNITIKNIKGYNAEGKSLDVTLLPNRINLVIAPNGFGKTSLTTAFSSLRANGLEVALENKNQENPNLKPYLSVTEDGVTYSADELHNDISLHLLPHIIHCHLGVYATAKRMGKAIPVTKYLSIQDVEVGKSEEPCFYRNISQQEKDAFGKKRLLLPHSLNELNGNLTLKWKLRDYGYALTVFKKQKTRASLLDECMRYILNYGGSANVLAQNYDPIVFDKIEADEHYHNFATLYRKYTKADRLHTFVVFHQLVDIYNQDARAFKKACDYAGYLRYRNFIEHELGILNNTWKHLKLEERNGKLYVVYPKARNISNGQRDLLTFIVDLIGFDSKMTSDQKGLLIIDEIFDYLDDANILVAQYYLTRILNKHKNNLYIVWLTHLSQDNFRSKVLNPKVLNVQYLKPVKAVPNECMKKFIATREALDRKISEQNDLYNDISHYILHYCPSEKDLTDALRPYAKEGMRVSWGRRSEFHSYLIEELNKYLREEDVYDPYAVAVAIRLRSEIKVYQMLTTDEQRDKFINTNETKHKFEAMESEYAIPVPVSYYVIASIHNEADHIRFDGHGNIPDASIVYKLNHLVVKKIVKELFDYMEGAPVTVDTLR